MEAWQTNKITIIFTYTEDFVRKLMDSKKIPGLIKVTINGKKYRICAGKPTRVPVMVATELEKLNMVKEVKEYNGSI